MTGEQLQEEFFFTVKYFRLLSFKKVFNFTMICNANYFFKVRLEVKKTFLEFAAITR